MRQTVHKVGLSFFTFLHRVSVKGKKPSVGFTDLCIGTNIDVLLGKASTCEQEKTKEEKKCADLLLLKKCAWKKQSKVKFLTVCLPASFCD